MSKYVYVQRYIHTCVYIYRAKGFVDSMDSRLDQGRIEFPFCYDVQSIFHE